MEDLLQPSSWIENFAYVPSKKELSIEIKDSGEVYTYWDVPAETANAMADAESDASELGSYACDRDWDDSSSGGDYWRNEDGEYSCG